MRLAGSGVRFEAYHPPLHFRCRNGADILTRGGLPSQFLLDQEAQISSQPHLGTPGPEALHLYQHHRLVNPNWVLSQNPGPLPPYTWLQASRNTSAGQESSASQNTQPSNAQPSTPYGTPTLVSNNASQVLDTREPAVPPTPDLPRTNSLHVHQCQVCLERFEKLYLLKYVSTNTFIPGRI
ncbi:hypothetical protein MRB53_038313 [Persea americana]|nr:hypothetical protein MRB53_038313 [Persea americana]